MLCDLYAFVNDDFSGDLNVFCSTFFAAGVLVVLRACKIAICFSEELIKFA